MQKFVSELDKVVGGAKEHHASLAGDSRGDKKRLQKLAAMRPAITRTGPDQKLPAPDTKGPGVPPEKVIPLEEGDFKDF